METARRPTVSGILESALYVSDVPRSRGFYTTIFGFEPLIEEEKFSVLNVVEKQVLLLFEHGCARLASRMPGGIIPPHDGRGELHIAFAVPPADLDLWEERLREHDVEVESRVRWQRGGTSLYFRDPDMHLVELVTPGLWKIY